mmetsp:Transcript_33350/g.92027  ORF Transcript_33350/g.92027 Transcript_33350/m.92027 type:complete len:385 (-) Transcript_33350:13-1167(-)
MSMRSAALCAAWAGAALAAGRQAIPSGGHPVALVVDADPALTARVGLDVDDDLALAFLAGAEHARLLGATATFGNAPLMTTCPRLQALLWEELGLNVPVACGPAMGGLLLEPVSWLLGWSPVKADNAAADLLVAATRAFWKRRAQSQELSTRRATDSLGNASRLIWLSLGAMTNVAAALRLLRAGQATQAALPDEVVLLGSRLDGAWDLNVWSDPEAAAYVLGEAPAFVNVTVVPQDAVVDAVIGEKWLERLGRECRGSWAVTQLSVLRRFAWLAGKLQRGAKSPEQVAHGFRPWDVAAAAAATYPDAGLFRDASCRRAECSGPRISVGGADVPCGAAMESGVFPVYVLRNLSVSRFLDLAFDVLCRVSGTGRQAVDDTLQAEL